MVLSAMLSAVSCEKSQDEPQGTDSITLLFDRPRGRADKRQHNQFRRLARCEQQ